MSALPPKADIWTHRVAAARSGIWSVKLTPIGVGSRVSSPPNCFKSAVTKRVPSRLLAVGSKLGGRPTPSSRTEIATDSFSVSTRTQIEPPGTIWVSILPRIRDKLIDDEPNKNRTIRRKTNGFGSIKLDFGRRDRRLQVADDLA